MSDIHWTTALPDWQARIVAGRSLVLCPPLFPGEAAAAMRIFEGLCLVDVAGRPTFGQVARPWSLDFARAVFGSYDAESGRRLIRQFLLAIAKKNAKSTLAAGLMLTLLLRNWRPTGEFLILAPTIEVAGNSFGPARGKQVFQGSGALFERHALRRDDRGELAQKAHDQLLAKLGGRRRRQGASAGLGVVIWGNLRRPRLSLAAGSRPKAAARHGAFDFFDFASNSNQKKSPRDCHGGCWG